MSSRMSKYYDETNTTNSRYHKNEDLYKEINKSELNNFDIKSNATILGDNEKEIDVEKIKKILDTKYNETPQRKSIRLEKVEEVVEERETTKEYDINVILEKAKEQKQDNYDEERLKKLRDTQFNILKNLNLEKYEEVEPKEEIKEDDDLKTLINTIAFNEKQQNNSSPLDILSDLKGSDDTEVLDGLKEEIEDKEMEEIESVLEEELNKTNSSQMVNSFYTSSNALKHKDFEDIDDFSKEVESNNIFLKITIAVIAVIFIIGVIIIIKTVIA